MRTTNTQGTVGTSYITEAVGGLATFLTMSYIFLLNPSLLSKVGIDPTAAYLATLFTGVVSTVAMGLFARLPYAVAPVPTVTTFFVFYVCGKMGLNWQEALGAVFVSGIFSIAATAFSIRENLIRSMPEQLKIAIMFAIGGFLVANGLKLGNILPYGSDGIDFSHLSVGAFTSKSAAVTGAGFIVAIALSSKRIRFKAGPLFGLIVAAIVASRLGLEFTKPSLNFSGAFSAIGKVDLWPAVRASSAANFWLAAFVFFIVDFYGAIGKFVGLMEVTSQELNAARSNALGRALYVDSFGTVLGSFVGTSSVAVYISSAVGIMTGGRTGLSALFCAAFMILSAVLVPFIGSIPTVVNAGILIYIGTILMPWNRLSLSSDNMIVAAISLAGAAISLVTYRIDDGLLLAFGSYCVLVALKKEPWIPGASIYLVVTSGLLLLSVAAQYVFV